VDDPLRLHVEPTPPARCATQRIPLGTPHLVRYLCSRTCRRFPPETLLLSTAVALYLLLRAHNPDYFIAHRVQRRRLKADDAQGGVPPLVLPPPLSQLPWDLAQEEFGVAGTDFLGHLGRVLLVAVQDQKTAQVIDSKGDSVRLPP
jgi:hypothetical protein